MVFLLPHLAINHHVGETDAQHGETRELHGPGGNATEVLPRKDMKELLSMWLTTLYHPIERVKF